jgi:hypothetical protein
VNNGSQPQALIGPAMSSEQEDAHRRGLRDTYLADADAAVEAIEEKKRGIDESLKAAKAEVKRLKSLGDTPEAGDI